MKKIIVFVVFTFLFVYVQAQKDPEFTKGTVIYLESHHGLATRFNNTPDIFVGHLSLTPQFTIFESYLRMGASASLLFTNKKLGGLFGPNLAFKLTTLNAKKFGSLLNLQIKAEQLWGTGKQKLVGGGIGAEVGQIILISITLHRDYGLNYWWLQGGLGYNLFRKKKNGPTDPLEN